MNLETRLRQLAKTSYWQQIYNNSKEIGCINLFENTKNFSAIQISFLHWLKVYNLLYEELAQYSNVFLTEKVIQNDIRTDAYLHYRSKKLEQDWKKHKIEEQKSKLSRNKKHSGKVTPFSVDMQR